MSSKASSNIDNQGVADIRRSIPLPKYLSAEAREIYSKEPFLDASTKPLWKIRDAAKGALKSLEEVFRSKWPVDVDNYDCGPASAKLVSPKDGASADKILICLHGGGFVIGGGDNIVEAIPIAAMSSIPVLCIDYSLAPEHPFPIARDEIVSAYEKLLETYDPNLIGIFGSSAGASLTMQVVFALRELGLALPGALGCLTMPADLGDFGDSGALFTPSGFWGELDDPSDKNAWARAYLGDVDPDDPAVAPLKADLAGLPPTIFYSGTRDFFLSGTVLCHQRMRESGCVADLHVAEGMPHAHWIGLMPEAEIAQKLISEFFVHHLKGAK